MLRPCDIIYGPDRVNEYIYSGLWGHADTYHRCRCQMWLYLQCIELHTSNTECTPCTINAQQSTIVLYAKICGDWSPWSAKDPSEKSFCGWSLNILPWYRILNTGVIMGDIFIIHHIHTNCKLYYRNRRGIHAYTKCTKSLLWRLHGNLGEHDWLVR